jgi:hypothetical protein
MTDMGREERREAFEVWLANPVTQEVFSLFGKMAGRCKDMWWKTSWESGNPDPRMLADLRGRYEAVEDMITIDFERFEDVREIENDESERD